MMTAGTAESAGNTATDGRYWRGTGGPGQLMVLTGYELRKLVAERRVVVFGLIQPLIMLVLFTQVFGRIVDPASIPGHTPYIDYVVPAVLVTTGIGPAMNAGTALVRDLDNGMLTRFRSLPVALFWVLCARSFGDLTRITTQITVLTICAAVLFSYSPAGGPAAAVGALAVAALVTWALLWVFMALGAWVRSIEVMQMIGFVTIMPLMFASSAFVPVTRLPGWLQAAATVNPMTYAVDASRHLSLGLPGTAAAVSGALVAAATLVAAAMLTADRGFRRPTMGR